MIQRYLQQRKLWSAKVFSISPSWKWKGFSASRLASGLSPPSLPSVLPLLRQGHWLSRAKPEGNFSSGALRRSQLAKWLELRKSKWSFPRGPAVTALRLIKPLIFSLLHSRHTSWNCCFQKRSPKSVMSDYRPPHWDLPSHSAVWDVYMYWMNDALFHFTFMKQHFLEIEPLHMLLLRVIPSETEESWEWSAVLEAILWLSDYPCVPPASPSSLTSSLGLIVNRSCLLSDLVWWWYRPSAMPSFHLHFPSFLWAVTVSKCARVVQKPSKIRQTSENQLDVDAIIFKAFPLYWELLVLIVPVG